MKGFQVSGGTFSLNRRHFGHLALGGAAALALAACGGGEGGGDDLSQNASSLRPAHNALQAGMNKQDVINTVGRPPDTDIQTSLVWRLNGEDLHVTFEFDSRDQSWSVTASAWYAAPPSMEVDIRQFV